MDECNRKIKKNGGYYQWEECKTLIDANSMEPCSSSILSLVQKTKIDYELKFPSKHFIEFILNDFDNENIYKEYAELLSQKLIIAFPKKNDYELSFFIGNIRDLLADSTGLFKDELEEQLSLMQKKVKYGVPTLTALSICEKVFYDRLLAVRITYLLADSDISEDEIVSRLKQRREDVELLLNDYPEFFWKRIISVLY